MKSWTLIAVLALGAALAWASLAPPKPRSEIAPPQTFSAARAMADVREIARAPRPSGSVEHARTADLLLRRLGELGLEVREQRTDVVSPEAGFVTVGGAVRNLVGVLPGRDRALPAVLLMSHYDSVPSSPGAADDAAGVAATLEIVRALRASPQPRQRDVVVLFTDGEEAGLLGAHAFFAQDPLAGRIGAVLNMDVRGSAGPAIMYETGREAGGWIELFAETTSRPTANSLTTWIYERMPNGTDFTVPKSQGVGGMNFSFLYRPVDYHSASATAAHLDPRSVQHLGDQVLAATKALAGAQTLPAAAPDQVYSDVLGRGVVRYPAWAGWLVLAAAAVFGGAALAGAVRKGFVVWRDAARGAGLLLLVGAATALVLRLAHGPLAGWMGWAAEARQPLALAGSALLGTGVALLVLALVRRDTRRLWPVLAILALGALAAVRFGGFDPLSAGLTGVAAVLAALVFGRAAGGWCLWIGLLGLSFGLTLVVQILAPTAAFLFAWPLLLASLAAAAVMFLADGDFAKPIALANAGVLGVIAFAWLARFGGTLFVAMGFGMAELFALFAVLALPVLWPLAAVWTRGSRPLAGAGVVIAAGAALLACVQLCDPASVRTPRPEQAFVVADPQAGRTWRVSGGETLGPWAKAALEADGGRAVRAPLPELFADEVWRAPARPVAAVRPQAVLSPAGPSGRRVLMVRPSHDARELRLSLKASGPVTDVTVNGRPAPQLMAKPGEWSRLRWMTRLNYPVEIGFTAKGPGRLELKSADVVDGWPAQLALPARPPESAPVGLSGSTVTVGRARFDW